MAAGTETKKINIFDQDMDDSEIQETKERMATDPQMVSFGRGTMEDLNDSNISSTEEMISNMKINNKVLSK